MPAGWQSWPWQALAVVLAAMIAGVVAIVGLIVNHVTRQGERQGEQTRARIDALATSLGARVDTLQASLAETRMDVARLGTRVGTIPARVVDDDDCRERHEQLREEIVSLSSGRRLVVTGFGGDR
jgi:hypothetical protein